MNAEQALKMAREALETCKTGGYTDVDGDWCERQSHDRVKVATALAAIKTASPVAYGAIRVCPERNIECGSNSAAWCVMCPKKVPLAEQYPGCTRVLREAGKHLPRTCKECGTGACKAYPKATPPVAEAIPAQEVVYKQAILELALKWINCRPGQEAREAFSRIGRAIDDYGQQQREEGRRDGWDSCALLNQEASRLKDEVIAYEQRHATESEKALAVEKERAEKAEAALADVHGDLGQQHDEPTGPNHPGHHDGMTCERAAQWLTDANEADLRGMQRPSQNRTLAGRAAVDDGGVSCCEHDSDCAVHNAPALPLGPCDCSVSGHVADGDFPPMPDAQ